MESLKMSESVSVSASTSSKDNLFGDTALKNVKWYYDKSELRDSPSFQDGIDADSENRYRREGARFIINVGSKMGLRYDTMATGVVFFHRFYMCHSFKKFPRYITACCCLFLAGKVEETPKKCRDLLKFAKSLLTEKQFVQFGDDPKEELMTLEKVVLQTIRFDFQVDHPYGYLLKYAKCLEGDKSKLNRMVQMAWTFVNDSLCTTLCLQWEPEIVAVGLMHLAGKLSKFQVVDWTNRTDSDENWWDVYVDGLTVPLLEDICHQVLDLYGTPAVPNTDSSPPASPPSKSREIQQALSKAAKLKCSQEHSMTSTPKTPPSPQAKRKEAHTAVGMPIPSIEPGQLKWKNFKTLNKKDHSDVLNFAAPSKRKRSSSSASLPYSSPKNYYGESGHSKRSPGHSKRSPNHSKRSPSHSKRSPSHSKRSPSHSKRSPSHSKRSPSGPETHSSPKSETLPVNSSKKRVPHTILYSPSMAGNLCDLEISNGGTVVEAVITSSGGDDSTKSKSLNSSSDPTEIKPLNNTIDLNDSEDLNENVNLPASEEDADINAVIEVIDITTPPDDETKESASYAEPDDCAYELVASGEDYDIAQTSSAPCETVPPQTTVASAVTAPVPVFSPVPMDNGVRYSYMPTSVAFEGQYFPAIPQPPQQQLQPLQQPATFLPTQVRMSHAAPPPPPPGPPPPPPPPPPPTMLIPPPQLTLPPPQFADMFAATHVPPPPPPQYQPSNLPPPSQTVAPAQAPQYPPLPPLHPQTPGTASNISQSSNITRPPPPLVRAPIHDASPRMPRPPSSINNQTTPQSSPHIGNQGITNTPCAGTPNGHRPARPLLQNVPPPPLTASSVGARHYGYRQDTSSLPHLQEPRGSNIAENAPSMSAPHNIRPNIGPDTRHPPIHLSSEMENPHELARGVPRNQYNNNGFPSFQQESERDSNSYLDSSQPSHDRNYPGFDQDFGPRHRFTGHSYEGNMPPPPRLRQCPPLRQYHSFEGGNGPPSSYLKVLVQNEVGSGRGSHGRLPRPPNLKEYRKT